MQPIAVASRLSIKYCTHNKSQMVILIYEFHFCNIRNSVRIKHSRLGFFQERLLLSILPHHIAVEVRKDISFNEGPKPRKLYAQRHEPVR
jgi:hypothetical protein